MVSGRRISLLKFPLPPDSIIPSRAVISKSIAYLNNQTVAALGMQALMKTEYVFGKPASGPSARNDLAFKSVRPFDFSVAPALINRNKVPQPLFHVTSTDIYVGAIRRSHVSQVKEKGQGTGYRNLYLVTMQTHQGLMLTGLP